MQTHRRNVARAFEILDVRVLASVFWHLGVGTSSDSWEGRGLEAQLVCDVVQALRLALGDTAEVLLGEPRLGPGGIRSNVAEQLHGCS